MLGFAGAAHAAVAPVTWCGADAAAADRVPDAAAGFQWHVVYAVPSDGTDRFASLASGIATDLASIDAWWNGQDASRRLRFDLFAFPGCAPGLGQLDLSSSRLPRPGADYAPLESRLDRIVADLNALPFGFASPDKKYLVYYDGPADEQKVCGQGNAGVTDGGPRAFAIVFLQACGQGSPGDGEGVAAITAVHEMTHALNAVLEQAPHYCNDGHVCDSDSDLLRAVGTSTDVLSAQVLDVGHDDYYGHSGTWWDAQDSGWLIRVGGPDTAPPVGPASLRVSSDGPVVTLTWPRAVDDVGPVRYRVYRDGELVHETVQTRIVDRGVRGRTIVYGVRAADGAGFLSPLVEVRFKVGAGVVDPAGRLLADTVAPPPVTGLRGVATGGALLLRWHAVTDPGGIRGYVVERNGRRFATVKRTRLSIPGTKSKGLWTVRAVDRAGNVGRRLQAVRFS